MTIEEIRKHPYWAYQTLGWFRKLVDEVGSRRKVFAKDLTQFLEMAQIIDNPEWDDSPADSWRREVPEEIREIWSLLSMSTRTGIYVMAVHAARREEKRVFAVVEILPED